jgi:N-acetylmuramoyl-L-alanine amidase
MKASKSTKINFYKNFFLLILLSLTLLNIQSFPQQVTGLSGWNIYLDPGHSQDENMGIYGYSEAKKVLRVGLNLRQMLLDWTDIDTVYICRTNDQQSVSLSDRTTHANTVGAAWYHSIHSNASSSPSSNNTLLLWGQYENNLEKVPNGGKAMSALMIPLLTAGMRIPTIGSYGDHTFYGGCPTNPPRPCPWLWINYATNMPSELSEAGFHTNPTQNQLNMNASWKRLEAKTIFWTILKYHNLLRPYVGTVVGIVKDLESGLAVNGAIVSVNGQSDTTDTWESLFHLYNSDPDFLRNGFYYLEDVPAGTYPLQITASGYDPISVNVTMADTFFTFKDVNLVSNVPPTIASTVPVQNDSLYPGVESAVINFSRQMNKTSVEANLSISPSVTFTTAWSNSDKTLTINTTDFAFTTQYQITIGGNSEGKYGHLFDGDGNGVGGDSYTLTVMTKIADVTAPNVSDVYPSANANNVEYKPVINVSFNELLKTSTISSRFKIVRNSTQTNAAGILKHYVVKGRSVLNFFITTPLFENESYRIKVQAGVEDIFGNPTPIDYTYEFTTGNLNYFAQSIIDNFENGVSNWWQPETSGNTVGVFPLTTSMLSSSAIWNLNTGGTKSMQLNYDWDTTAPDWLIREYYSPVTPTFQPNTLLQVFLFGDGGDNKFRFAVRETAPGNFEVSPWYDVDWIGWKLVTWDLSLGQTGNWVGNNVFEPPLSFDSFQMTYVTGNQSTGTYYFDDIRTATFSPTDVEEEIGTTPTEFSLQQNYPNPFNPNTQIKFSVPQTTNVKVLVTDLLGREVATLVNDNLTAGNYSVNFDAINLSSGVYFYTLITDNFKQSRKMILMK